ncbi:MAG: ABC transporter substrate-binding protein, partial [Flavobacteriaceae bacterium]|nr:ABC transporter substrate-binding protein [Flavobacteriaceae bacterium]
MHLRYFIGIILGLQIVLGCKDPKTISNLDQGCENSEQVTYAKGFCLAKQNDYTLLKILNPSTGQIKQQIALVPEGVANPEGFSFDDVIKVPIKSIVTTSTTHIPPLELLDRATALSGFPNLDYISSSLTRARIDAGLVQELGQNEALNIEVLVSLKPDVLMTFSIDETQKGLEKVKQAGIPLIYNGDWTEQHPLGKAEWIKVFGALFGIEAKADSIFQSIEKEYLDLKSLAKQSSGQPTVISGALYKDIWYAPKGDSWAAKFIEDANGLYLWKDTAGTGSLQWNIEEILQFTQKAHLWIGPGQFTSYDQMAQSSPTYTQFKPFRDK